jgi:hypothetical protein
MVYFFIKNINFLIFKLNINKGFRKVKNSKENSETPFLKYETQEKVDPELGCKIVIRED